MNFKLKLNIVNIEAKEEPLRGNKEIEEKNPAYGRQSISQPGSSISPFFNQFRSEFGFTLLFRDRGRDRD